MTSSDFYCKMPLPACLLACVAIDLFYFPHGTVLPDEQRFLASAAKLAASGEFWLGVDRAWEMPGTAIFFALFVKLFGVPAAIMPIRLAQAVLLAMQIGLMSICARLIFRKEAPAFISCCIGAIYPFFLFYQGLLLSETLFDTLLMAGFAALFWWRQRGCRIEAALIVACLCFAAGTLTKATLTVLPPLLLGITAWTAGAGWKRTAAILAVASCAYGAFLTPWWIRNAALFHSFVPFSTNSALNLYVGNNPHNPNAGLDWSSDVEPEVFARFQAMPDELARQRAFSQRALDYIKAEPGAFLLAAIKKFVRFWNIVPNAAEFSSRFYAVLSALSFGPVLLLALACALRLWRQWRLLAPIYLAIGYFTFLHISTIASLRYRLPLEPLLIVMAAEPLAALWAKLRGTPEDGIQPA